MNKQGKLYFVAGGTGGHIFAAKAVGDYFSGQGYNVEYISGKRPLDFKLFKNQKVLHVDSMALVGKNPFFVLKSLAKNFFIFLRMLKFFSQSKPNFIFGAGGYVCGPVILAGKCLGIKTVILEQNSVAGLTNKLLSLIVDIVFTAFLKTKGIEANKTVLVGNPVRSDFYQKAIEHKALDERLKILVIGGSLGSVEINQAVFSLIQNEKQLKLEIRHQVGKGHIQNEIKFSENIQYKQFEFIEDIFSQYSWADVILSRAGGSTVAELRLVQKPTIFFPLRLHKDQHQVHNAENLKSEVSYPVLVTSGKSFIADDYREFKEFYKEVLNEYDYQNYKPASTLENPVEKIYSHLVSGKEK